jgi:hypothetical protein
VSPPRTLIWTPAPTAELQLALHRSSADPGVLVPVASGTVVLAPQKAGLSAVGRQAVQCQAAGRKAVLLRWNARAAVGRSFPSEDRSFWYMGSITSARRLAGWLKVSRRASAAAFFELPADSHHDDLAALLRDALRPDLAQVVELVTEGRADPWTAALPAPGRHPINTALPVIPVTQGAAPTEPPLA